MSEGPPLSRFDDVPRLPPALELDRNIPAGGQNPKPRPTDTLIIPGIQLASAVVMHLLIEREIFTVEPSPTQEGVWHVGVFESGKEIALQAVRAMGHS